MATMSSVNPATGEVLARFDELTDAELEARLARAARRVRARGAGGRFAERAALMAPRRRGARARQGALGAAR